MRRACRCIVASIRAAGAALVVPDDRRDTPQDRLGSSRPFRMLDAAARMAQFGGERTEVRSTMTWPGNDLWRPYVGLVARLSRDHYNPGDQHARRPTVVVKVLAIERVCIVVTRTSDNTTVRRGDVAHHADANVGCDRPGWWQPRRAYRVSFSAYDDEDTCIYKKLDEETLDRVMRAYEERS